MDSCTEPDEVGRRPAAMIEDSAGCFDDYQVAVQAPPPGSGLPALPADTGLVQAFSGHRRVMVVAMGGPTVEPPTSGSWWTG
ncbi:hypothetical protein [Streptomyces sp. A1136]|uniref:hypothetical protein n=1 Tax=Streptomyces sp. A1136 TaxID=2563102 RepID=UPI00109E8A7C|nr:hypothetical protein [Streptomyces sp. A1136]THA47730.1 hypothetical protein E6R62_30655 [Streptomyces sp. A1136]